MDSSSIATELANRKSAPVPLSANVKKAVDLYFAQLNGHDTAGLYAMVMSQVEKPLLECVLEHTGYNQTKAAKILGLSRSTLRKKLDEYRIPAP
jgi:Fis family transcriptional regulator, factor for inversion stimulation protein